jgi:hypothetical protein
VLPQAFHLPRRANPSDLAYPHVRMMTAKVTTDGSAPVIRYVRDGFIGYPFGTMPVVVGCGYAARFTAVQETSGKIIQPAVIVRLRDGVTHYVDTLPPDATSFARVVGLTCDEVFFCRQRGRRRNVPAQCLSSPSRLFRTRPTLACPRGRRALTVRPCSSTDSRGGRDLLESLPFSSTAASASSTLALGDSKPASTRNAKITPTSHQTSSLEQPARARTS